MYHLSANKSSDKIATLYLIVQFIYVLLMSPDMNSASLGGCLINLLTNPKMLNYLLEHNTWHCFYFVFLKGPGYTFQCLCLTVRNKIGCIIQIALWAEIKESIKSIFLKSLTDSGGLFNPQCLKLFWTAWTKYQIIISLACPWFQWQLKKLHTRSVEFEGGTQYSISKFDVSFQYTP